MLGEFTGTFLFLFFAFAGTQVANTKDPGATVSSAPEPAALLYISLSFGFSLAVNAWVALGLCLVGALPWTRGALLLVSEMLGGIVSAAIVQVLFPGPLNVRTALSPGTSLSQGLFIEMFLTAQLVFTIFMLAAEKHKATFIAPIYWLGPVLGALLASAFYKFIKALEYETANPGQDFDDREDEFFDPSRDTSRPIVNLVPDGSVSIQGGNSRPESEGLGPINPGPSDMEQPPPPGTRDRQSRLSAIKRDKGTPSSDSRDGREDDPTTASETRFREAPSAEAGKAVPRMSGQA
ncbi:MAG: hypothetical protein Q9220_006953 [cf. Caloplaca sp. 1 TL-2023]